MLSRAAAAEMFPPERRARGMSFVLFGAVAGAIFGPLDLRPALRRPRADARPARLAVARLVALRARAASSSRSLVRPDPKELSKAFVDRRRRTRSRRRRSARSCAGPACRPRCSPRVASFAVMVGVMNLAGYVAVGHGHAHGDVFTVISAHIVGMYGLVLVAGDLDRPHRPHALDGDRPDADGGVERRPRLARRASPACRSRSSGSASAGTSPTSPRPPSSSRSRAPSERGRLVGFSDLRSSFTGAALAARRRRRLQRGRLGAARGRSRQRSRPLPAAWILLLPSVRRRAAGAPFLRLKTFRMKTYSAKTGEITRDWYVVDAEGQILGRLATQIADRLRGKGKPQYTPHVDTGDFVVVVNAEKIAVTGNKLDAKMYYRHSGYPGGLKQRPLREQLERRPTEVLRKAVKGMLPRTGSRASRSRS